MVLEIIETYIVGGVVGFVVGVVASRIYFKSRIESKAIGHVIEYAMIHGNIERLSSMSASLSQLVADLQECSEDITEQLELTQDIEGSLIQDEKKAEGEFGF